MSSQLNNVNKKNIKTELPDEIWNLIKDFVFDWKRSHKQKLHKVLFCNFPDFCWEMRPIYITAGVFPPLPNTNDIIRDVREIIMYWDEEEEPPPNLQLTTITWKPGGYWEFGYGWYKQGCI